MSALSNRLERRLDEHSDTLDSHGDTLLTHADVLKMHREDLSAHKDNLGWRRGAFHLVFSQSEMQRLHTLNELALRMHLNCTVITCYCTLTTLKPM